MSQRVQPKDAFIFDLSQSKIPFFDMQMLLFPPYLKSVIVKTVVTEYGNNSKHDVRLFLTVALGFNCEGFAWEDVDAC